MSIAFFKGKYVYLDPVGQFSAGMNTVAPVEEYHSSKYKLPLIVIETGGAKQGFGLLRAFVQQRKVSKNKPFPIADFFRFIKTMIRDPGQFVVIWTGKSPARFLITSNLWFQLNVTDDTITGTFVNEFMGAYTHLGNDPHKAMEVYLKHFAQITKYGYIRTNIYTGKSKVYKVKKDKK